MSVAHCALTCTRYVVLTDEEKLGTNKFWKSDERFRSRVVSRFARAASAHPARAMSALTLGREVQVRARIKSMCVPTRLGFTNPPLSSSLALCGDPRGDDETLCTFFGTIARFRASPNANVARNHRAL